jgi:peptide/nickel transport system permease protein
LLGTVLAIIIVGPHVAPYSAYAIAVGPQVAGPSLQHLFGTDELGRDVLSRFLSGGGGVLILPLTAVALSLSAGGLLGMFAAYRGGVIDALATRLFDLILILPPLLLVIVLIAGFGDSPLAQIVSVTVVYIPQFGRVVRGASRSIITADYVAAAVARGEHTFPILIREVVPNIATPLLPEVALRVTYATMFIASLDFLGLGSQPPSSDWGLMVANGQSILTIAPLVSVIPACAIAMLCISYSLIADALSRYLRHEIKVAE